MPTSTQAESLVQDIVGHVVVRRYLLNVVAVVERFQQLEDGRRLVFVDRHCRLRAPGDLDPLRRTEARGQRLVGLAQGFGRANHLVPVRLALALVGADLECGFEDVVVARRVRGKANDPNTLEQIVHRARLAERAAVPAEDRADLGCGPVAVVGDRIDDNGDTAGPEAFVAQGVEALLAAVPARRLLQRALDIVLWHAMRLCRRDGRAQPGIVVRVGRAFSGRNVDFADQLREPLGPPGILRALAVHDVGPFGMTGHGLYSIARGDSGGCREST